MSFPLDFDMVVMSFPFQWFLIHLYHITLEKFSPEIYVKFRGHAPLNCFFDDKLINVIILHIGVHRLENKNHIIHKSNNI